MITFTIDGIKQEFDDDDMTNAEFRDVKRVTGLGFNEFWEACSEVDPDAVTAIVWLTRRRGGEEDLKFSDVKFNLMEVAKSIESDKGTDVESDPTDDADVTPSS